MQADTAMRGSVLAHQEKRASGEGVGKLDLRLISA
jgi:hypothetical protein